jgi:GYF domain 2
MYQMESQIYLLNDNQKVGPYTAKYLLEQVKTGELSLQTSAWQPGFSNWVPLSNLIHPCPQCGGELWRVNDYPQKGTGIIVMVLGILFAVFCVGIILMIWGFVLINQTKSTWHCRNCGRTFPG